MRIRGLLSVALAATFVAAPGAATAQDGAGARPAPVVEVTGGYAGFLDDAIIEHGVFGGSARVYLLPRVSVGPEIVYMVGPHDDRDLFVTGNLTFDILGPSGGRPRRVTPFLVAGGGWFRHSDRFGFEEFSSTEGAFTAGGGLRAWASERVFLAADARVGWEPHVRFTGTVGFALGR
jgi:hypothetical protein